VPGPKKPPLGPPRLDADQVGIVGYGWDRNEGDHRGNLAELSRLLSGLGLKLASCWLSGAGVSRLENIARARTIISFPYARTAARTIAQRLGARLLECELPIGIEATCDWLREVGRATNRIERAEAFIERELGQLVPRLEWLLPFAIQGKRALLLGDRHLVGALARALPELGVEPACQIHWNDPRAGEREQPENLLVGPTHREVAERIGSWLTHGIDLAFSNSDGLLFLLRQPAPPATVEIGYPSYHTHALLEAPILGFRGVLGLVERMLNRLAFKALSESVRHPADGREKGKKTPS
jgi:nitrogenase molybdenum-iron protein alpha chain